MYLDEKIIFRKRMFDNNISLELKFVNPDTPLNTTNNPRIRIVLRVNAVLSISNVESVFEVSLNTIGAKPISINFDNKTVNATIEEKSPYCSTPRLRAINVTETRVMSISAPLPTKMEETLLETFVVCCIGWLNQIL
jgi:hypothetical protein